MIVNKRAGKGILLVLTLLEITKSKKRSGDGRLQGAGKGICLAVCLFGSFF